MKKVQSVLKSKLITFSHNKMNLTKIELNWFLTQFHNSFIVINKTKKKIINLIFNFKKYILTTITTTTHRCHLHHHHHTVIVTTTIIPSLLLLFPSSLLLLLSLFYSTTTHNFKNWTSDWSSQDIGWVGQWSDKWVINWFAWLDLYQKIEIKLCT